MAAPRYTNAMTQRSRATEEPFRANELCIQLALEQLIGELRVGLASGGLHHLSDEKAEGLLLPAPVLRDGIRVPRQNVTNGGHNRRLVADLRKPLGFDD